MMKGLLKPSPDVYDLIVNKLNLGDKEISEFNYYIGLINTNENRLRTRAEISKLLYNIEKEQVELNEIEVVVYENERYLKQYNNLLNQLLEHIQNPNCNVEIKLHNCIDVDYIEPLTSLLAEVDASNIRIEHLITFYEDDSAENILTLKAILQLMRYNYYKVLYKDKEYNTNPVSLFGNFIIINISGEVNKLLFISFGDDQYADCFVSEDKNLEHFLLKSYKSLRENYKHALIKEVNVDYLTDRLYEFENGGKFFLINSFFKRNRAAPINNLII